MVGVVEGDAGLAALRKIARHDLARLNYPAANWVPERTGPDGKRVLDVLVVGAEKLSDFAKPTDRTISFLLSDGAGAAIVGPADEPEPFEGDDTRGDRKAAYRALRDRKEDTAEFHAAMQAACDPHNETYYERYSKWAEEYFYIPHRQVGRGVGGIFADHLECADDAGWAANFEFIKDIGKQFLIAFPAIVRRRMNMPFTPEDEAQMFEYRGRYAEFNLVYDRGTIFGLKTGGNIDAILMSLPPRATWS